MDDKKTTAEQNTMLENETATVKVDQERSLVDDDLSVEYAKEKQATQKERIRNWKLKKAKLQSFLEYSEGEKDSSNGNIAPIVMQWKTDNNLSEAERVELYQANLTTMSGSASYYYQNIFLNQTLNALVPFKSITTTQRATAITEVLLSMNPADEYEAMLCRRMIVLDNQYMHYMAITASDCATQLKDKYVNMASKLMTRYDQTLETLNRHRRKGEQKVRVTYNHVNVNEGGQAVVGTVNTGSGGRDATKNE
jgi:hypothetical protein